MLKKIALLFVLAAAIPAVVPTFDNPIPCPWVDYCSATSTNN